MHELGKLASPQLPMPPSDEDHLADSVRPTFGAAGRRLALCKLLYWGRRQRPGADDPRLFGEPAWDMVLDLYIHQAGGASTSIIAACVGSHAPTTTALRYIDLLCELGWVDKIPDENDRRRSFLALTPAALERLDKHLDRLLERLWRVAPDLLPGSHADDPRSHRRRA